MWNADTEHAQVQKSEEQSVEGTRCAQEDLHRGIGISAWLGCAGSPDLQMCKQVFSVVTAPWFCACSLLNQDPGPFLCLEIGSQSPEYFGSQDCTTRSVLNKAFLTDKSQLGGPQQHTSQHQNGAMASRPEGRKLGAKSLGAREFKQKGNEIDYE